MAGAQKHVSSRVPRAVVHVPHSSTRIPDDILERLDLSGAELRAELRQMTDLHTDELFALPPDLATAVIFPISRLVVDPERFEQDEREPMAAKGMGVIYTETSDGRRLRREPSPAERQDLLERFYRPHHAVLTRAVDAALQAHGGCLIIDGHSFPSRPLPYEDDQRPTRPDICIGTDDYHTPRWLAEEALALFRARGWRVERNRPFGGALVPLQFYRCESRVWSVMVELNRSLYMNEPTGSRATCFDRLRTVLGRLLGALIDSASERLQTS